MIIRRYHVGMENINRLAYSTQTVGICLPAAICAELLTGTVERRGSLLARHEMTGQTVRSVAIVVWCRRSNRLVVGREPPLFSIGVDFGKTIISSCSNASSDARQRLTLLLEFMERLFLPTRLSRNDSVESPFPCLSPPPPPQPLPNLRSFVGNSCP